MFRDLDVNCEEEFYSRILGAWQETNLGEEEASVWISKFIIEIMAKDRENDEKKDATLARILTNCLVLVLALLNDKPVDLYGFPDLFDLPEEERAGLLQDIASHINCAVENHVNNHV